jgi:hypothetical protein
VLQGLKKIADEFASIDHSGPNHVADFADAYDDERELIKRDAYEYVNYFLTKLGLI